MGVNQYAGYYLSSTTAMSQGTNISSVITAASATGYYITMLATYAPPNNGGTNGAPGSGSKVSTYTSNSNYLFYYDGALGTPTVSTVTLAINNNTYATPVCGVYMFGQNTTPVITGTATGVTNVGTYFYNKTNLLVWTPTIGGTGVTSTTENSTANITAGSSGSQFTGPLTIQNTSLNISTSLSSYQTTFGLSAVAYNINNISSSSVSATNISVIYDPQSITLAYYNNQTIPVFGSSGAPAQGIRLSSTSTAGNEYVGTNLSTGTPTFQSNVAANNLYNGTTPYSSGAIYDNTQLISGSVANYSKEAMMYLGRYYGGTNGTVPYISYTSYYYGTSQNLANYASIPSSNGYRYVTYVWNASGMTTGSNNITFNIIGLNNVNIQPANNNQIYYTSGGARLQFFYRVEDSTNSTTALNWPSSGQISSPWADANLVAQTGVANQRLVAAGNVTNTNFTPAGCAGSSSITYTGGNASFNVNIAYSSSSFNSATYIYARVGLLATDTSNYFSYMTAGFT